MNKLFLFFVFAGVAFAWHAELISFSGSRGPSSAQLKIDPCAGKKTCALVYVAPWCPACKSMASVIRDFGKNKKQNTGFKVVIGQGRDAGENENALPTYGYNARVDQDDAIFHQLGVTKFPSFYVLDSEGAKIVEDADAYQWMHENLK